MTIHHGAVYPPKGDAAFAVTDGDREDPRVVVDITNEGRIGCRSVSVAGQPVVAMPAEAQDEGIELELAAQVLRLQRLLLADWARDPLVTRCLCDALGALRERLETHLRVRATTEALGRTAP